MLTRNLIKELSEKYLVDAVYFSYKNHVIDSSLKAVSITSFKAGNVNSLREIKHHPIFTRRFNKHILNYLKSIINLYDILFFDFTQAGLYSLFLEHPYKVIRCHDILYQKFSRKDVLFRGWVKKTEKKILDSVNKIFVLSQKDADIVKNIYNHNSCFVHERIPDFTFYNIDEVKNDFLFFGLWSRKENANGLNWFIENVMPLIPADKEINFHIIGAGLPKKLENKYHKYKNIDYPGFVEKPLDVIYRSRAVIAPLFTGAGVKIKVIDAFTTGTPVIGTEIAFEGLPSIKELSILANLPEEYRDKIVNFPNLSSTEKEKNANLFKGQYENNYLVDAL
ncbi:glycosyl transferase family 1 [Spirochaetia bacterium]|nr:glycosyl transferase family 1 [Spirochaetia bacterium]